MRRRETTISMGKRLEIFIGLIFSFDCIALQMSDWDRYAAEEYELLVAEEGGNDQQDSL